MIVKIFRKLKSLYKKFREKWKKDNWNLYRVFIFVTSRRGQKKIKSWTRKGFYYFYHEIVGAKDGNPNSGDPYEVWKHIFLPKEKDIKDFKRKKKSFKYKPKVSIIMPAYNTKKSYLKECVDSVINQIYENWELCIADDNSTSKETIRALQKYDKHPKIKVVFRKENGHISKCSNSALELATGEYVALLDHDDVLPPEALYQVIKELQEERHDLIYSDEDKIDELGNTSGPYFKPDWSPDTFNTRNYLGHFIVMKKELIDAVGGFRVGFEGSQDYDLLLRATEKTNKISHIPKILYHWRMHEDSTAQNMDAKSYAFISGVKALDESFERRGVKAKAELVKGTPGFYSIKYEVKEKKKVSIIIPSKDKAEVLELCLKSIFEKTTYPDFEVVVINNNSEEKSFFDLIDTYKKEHPSNFKCMDLAVPFNYSYLMNRGIEPTDAHYILLLNNDTEVIHGNWIDLMVEYGHREDIGAVGVKLLYHNDTVQHGGVIIGLGGVAGHTFIGAGKNEMGYYGYLKTVTNYSAVTAACVLFKKSAWKEVDGFDEGFEIEYNDTDFCLKLLDKGYRNVFVPDVTLYHYESLSRGHPLRNPESTKRHNKEVAHFESKWKKYIDNDPHYNPNLSRLIKDFECMNFE